MTLTSTLLKNFYCVISIDLFLENGRVLSFKLWIPFTQGCQSKQLLGPWLWRVMFVIVINTFCYLGIVFSEKRVELSILKSLTCSHPRVFMLCLVEIGQVVWEKRILSVINIFSVLYRFGKGRGPSFKQTWITFNPEYSVPSFVDFGCIVLEERTVKYHHCIYAVSWVSLPLEMIVVLYLNSCHTKISCAVCIWAWTSSFI